MPNNFFAKVWLISIKFSCRAEIVSMRLDYRGFDIQGRTVLEIVSMRLDYRGFDIQGRTVLEKEKAMI